MGSFLYVLINDIRTKNILFEAGHRHGIEPSSKKIQEKISEDSELNLDRLNFLKNWYAELINVETINILKNRQEVLKLNGERLTAFSQI